MSSSSRKIQLTRIHALNWFGYNDTLDVQGNLLIAGVTGSGKSILMDLIQLVLVGDQKSKYNQSATGAASTRNLKGYCLGDTKQDIDGASQYMRDKGSITYVALEFEWPGKSKRVETWGLRIEFDSAAQNQPSHRNGFLIPRKMKKTDWLHEDRTPLDYASFKRFVAEHKGTVFETMESYRREMAIPTRLNFDRGTLDYLLPTAMSFTFLRSFNDFCRQYILPANSIDIQPVKESFIAFRNFERELGILRDQMERLQAIREKHAKHQEKRRDQSVYRYVGAELRMEAAKEEWTELHRQIAEIEKKMEKEKARLIDLDTQIADDERQIASLNAALNATEDGKLYLHLREQNKDLVAKIGRLKEIGKTVDEAVQARIRNTTHWLGQLKQLPVKVPEAAREVEFALSQLQDARKDHIRERVRNLALAVQGLAKAIQGAGSTLFSEESELEKNRQRLSGLLAALKLGIVPDASKLLNLLNERLPRRGGQNPAQALRQLCEVNDEAWRAAVEIAFARKFAIVVGSEDYDQAERLYREWKEDSRESLINPTHALEMRGEINPGSLAEKIDVEHPVARAIVRSNFGDLICVEQVGDMRKHARAILSDGFQYQRPFVERRGHYQNNPCVGQKGLEKQRAHLENQIENVSAAQAALRPKVEAVRGFGEYARQHRLDSESIHDDLEEVIQLAGFEEQLQKNITQMNQISGMGFEEKEVQIREAEDRRDNNRRERDELLGSSRQGELVRLRRDEEEARKGHSRAEDDFRTIQLEIDISLYRPRRDEIRNELLTERPKQDLAAELCRERLHRIEIELADLRQQVIALRQQMALTYPVFTDLDPHSDGNEAYEAKLLRIEGGDIPGYEEKAKRERSNWQTLFRTQVLSKLHAALFEVENLKQVLNQELRSPIGNNCYQIHRQLRRDAEYKLYHDLVEASFVGKEDDLFFASMDASVRETIEDVFQKLISQPDGGGTLPFLDYRNYHDYDMLVTDVRDPDARPTSVDKQSGKFSGGENQSPYFVAILACYLRAYHRYERRRKDPSLALVPIDEAFSKLSGERIRDCIGALKQLDLQGVFSMSSGNIPYAMDMCDQMITVMKREETKGRRHRIRNIPVALTREEAIERYGIAD